MCFTKQRFIVTELDFGLLKQRKNLLKQRKNLLKQRKEAFETSFICLLAEGQGFFLMKASSTITNPRVRTLIQKKEAKRLPFLAEGQGFEPWKRF